MKKRIGFVGLGLMGRGMVRNLLSAGFPVVGYDIDNGKMEALTGNGFQKADIISFYEDLANIPA